MGMTINEMQELLSTECDNVPECDVCIFNDWEDSPCHNDTPWNEVNDRSTLIEAIGLYTDNKNCMYKLTTESKSILKKWRVVYKNVIENRPFCEDNACYDDYICPLDPICYNNLMEYFCEEKLREIILFINKLNKGYKLICDYNAQLDYGLCLEKKADDVCDQLAAGVKSTIDESTNNVDHPTHYTNDKYECIDVMQELFGKEAIQTFCLLNAFKYLWRHKQKNGNEDIEKANWYLQKHLELIDG